jgi:hypothetical protein
MVRYPLRTSLRKKGVKDLRNGYEISQQSYESRSVDSTDFMSFSQEFMKAYQLFRVCRHAIEKRWPNLLKIGATDNNIDKFESRKQTWDLVDSKGF